MTESIQIISSQPSIIEVRWIATNTYVVSISPKLEEMLAWYSVYKEQILKESKAREKFEAVSDAYEQYQMTLKLVLDQI